MRCFFTCAFDSSSNFLRLKKELRQAPKIKQQSLRRGTPSASHDLRQDCKVAAAKEYGLHRKDITVQKPVADKGGMHTVWGQFPSNQGSPTVFTCTFTGEHELVGVDINR